MPTGIVTKPDRTYLGGQLCVIDGKPFSQSKTKPRATCSPNCRQILHRLRKRQGEICTHPQHGTGTYRIAPGIANMAFWFTPGRGSPVIIRPLDIRFLKNRQPRPNRTARHSFTADHNRGHDPSFTGEVVNPEKNSGLGNVPGFDSRVRIYGKRTSRGRHRKHKDFSKAIAAYEMSILWRARRAREKAN